MLKQTQVLSDKMRIAFECEKPNLSQRHVNFYTKYSSFVFRALKKPSFQKFLYSILIKENIKQQMVNAVYVKVFPSPRKNGKGLAGKCDTVKGTIRLYPKTVNFCRAFAKKFGKNILLAYAGNRARAALIHELLHLKYVGDEAKVRHLTKNYFLIFTEKRWSNASYAIRIYTLIFTAKNAHEMVQVFSKNSDILISNQLPKTNIMSNRPIMNFN